MRISQLTQCPKGKNATAEERTRCKDDALEPRIYFPYPLIEIESDVEALMVIPGHDCQLAVFDLFSCERIMITRTKTLTA